MSPYKKGLFLNLIQVLTFQCQYMLLLLFILKLCNEGKAQRYKIL